MLLGYQISRNERDSACGRCGGEERHTGFWRGNMKEKRPLGRSGRRWKNNVKIDLQEMGREIWDWIYLAQDLDRWQVVVKTVMNLRVP